MAIDNTIGTVYMPFHNKAAGDYTQKRVEYLQTTGSNLSTVGAIHIIGTATSAYQYRLVSLNFCSYSVGANTLVHAYVGCSDTGNVISTLPTATAGQVSLYFGEVGLMIGATNTATLDIIVGGTTCGVDFVATFYKTA